MHKHETDVWEVHKKPADKLVATLSVIMIAAIVFLLATMVVYWNH